MAAATTVIARRSMTPMTRRIAMGSQQHWMQCSPRRRPCRQAVGRSRHAGALGASRRGAACGTRARSAHPDRHRRATPRRAREPTRKAPARAPAAARWRGRAGRDDTAGARQPFVGAEAAGGAPQQLTGARAREIAELGHRDAAQCERRRVIAQRDALQPPSASPAIRESIATGYRAAEERDRRNNSTLVRAARYAASRMMLVVQ
jgi:hypothetical protein